ncbi:hypothetical protein [Pseudomonas yamanorum]|uniref:hypothetical protein n=1 Tax=Pseudomonas yamanorum TaxID=515393 RepID=UPI003BA38366
MNQPFEIADRKTNIQGAIIIDVGRFAGVGLGLQENLGKNRQEVAGLLERRLSRIESALGLNPICAD